MGQRITIKSLNIKRGESDKGPWVNTIITPTEGSKWTGFSEGLVLLKEGDVIDISEYEEGQGNRHNKILKYQKVSNGAPDSAGATERTSAGGDSLEKRKSIEDQTRAKIIADLFKDDKATPELVVKLQDWLMELGEPAETAQKPAPSTGSKDGSTRQAISNGHFENAGQFMAAVSKEFGMKSADVNVRFNVNAPHEIKDFGAAWQELVDNKPVGGD